MRVLVTGTDGYIGVVLVSLLLQRGYDVRGAGYRLLRDACVLPASSMSSSSGQDT